MPFQVDRFPEDVVRKDDSGREVWLKPPFDDPFLVEVSKLSP
jgi:hypothetical protein